MYDVIVVGAGPSGSMTALTCADLKMDVVVVEKEKMPRLKTCGGSVSLKALKLIRSKIPNEVVESYYKGFRLFSPNLNSIDVISDQPIGITTHRDRFDSFLLQQAIDSGSNVIESNEVVDVKILKNKVECKLKDGAVLEGKILIGADGAYGKTAKMAGIRERWRKDEIGVCLESSCQLNKSSKAQNIINRAILELYFLNIPLGYAWLFPKKKDVSIGIGGCLAYLKKPRDLFTDFLLMISKTKKVKIKVSNISTHLAPAGGFKRDYFTDRVLLVGDAAGFIDPLSGEGIYYAMKSGIIAAEACNKAVKADEFERSFFEKCYRKSCENQFGKDLGIALNLTNFLHTHLSLLFDQLRKNPEYLLDTVTGNKTYRNYRRKILFLKLAAYLKREKG